MNRVEIGAMPFGYGNDPVFGLVTTRADVTGFDSKPVDNFAKATPAVAPA